MTENEIAKMYIKEPTEEMVEFAKCAAENLEYDDSLFCKIEGNLLIDLEGELLTDTVYWRDIDILHYTSYVEEGEKYTEEDTVRRNNIDLCIDNIIRKNPEFFKRYPINRIKKIEYNKDKEGKNFISCAGIGSIVRRLDNGKYKTFKNYIYTDGNIENVHKLSYTDEIIAIDIKDFSFIISENICECDDNTDINISLNV